MTKITQRHVTGKAGRILGISTSCVVERDPTTYAVVTTRPLTEIWCLIRPEDDPKALGIEYRDEQQRYCYAFSPLPRFHDQMCRGATVNGASPLHISNGGRGEGRGRRETRCSPRPRVGIVFGARVLFGFQPGPRVVVSTAATKTRHQILPPEPATRTRQQNPPSQPASRTRQQNVLPDLLFHQWDRWCCYTCTRSS